MLKGETEEASRRNDAQQLRLETLTAENSKLKKEATKLRSEVRWDASRARNPSHCPTAHPLLPLQVAGLRMSGFHQQLMQQELDGAKGGGVVREAGEAFDAFENATLRDGKRGSPASCTARDQLTAALDAREDGCRIGRAAAARGRQRQGALPGAARCRRRDRGEEAAAEASGRSKRAAVAARRQHGVRLVTLGAALPSAHDTSALVHAFATWSSAACFAEVGSICADVRAKVAMLGDQTSALAAVADELILDESGGGIGGAPARRPARQLARRADGGAPRGGGECGAEGGQLGPLSRRLQRREDDLVLMIERFEKLQATRPDISARHLTPPTTLIPTSPHVCAARSTPSSPSAPPPPPRARRSTR